MSARQSDVERDARKYAARWLRAAREFRGETSARDLLENTAGTLAREAARLLLAGDIPEARRHARAHQLVDESRERLNERRTRELDAKNARLAAAHGITAGDVVRVTRGDGITPRTVGTTHTVESVLGRMLFITVDGRTAILWADDVERVELSPIPDSGIEDVQVLTRAVPA